MLIELLLDMVPVDPEFMLPLSDIEPLDWPEVLLVEPEFCIDPEVCRPAICAEPAEAIATQAADKANKVIRFIINPLLVLPESHVRPSWKKAQQIDR